MESKLLFVATILLVLASSLNAAHLKRGLYDYQTLSSATTGAKRDISNLQNRQVNVECSAAEPLVLGDAPVEYDTINSFFYFFEKPEIIDAVSFRSIAPPFGSGFWFEFTGTGGSVEIDTCNGQPTSSRITVNIYKADSACMDIGFAVAGTSYQPDGACYGGNPTVSLCTEAGATYKVYVAAERTGNKFTISARSTGPCVSPANSNKDNAITISLDKSGETEVRGNNKGAPIQQVPCCNIQGICYTGNSAIAATWYRIVGTGAAITATVTVPNADVFDLDTAVSVFTDTDKGLVCEAGADDQVYSHVYQPKVTFATVKDQEYYVAVSTYEGSMGGNFTMTLETSGLKCDSDNTAPVIEGLKLEKITKNNEIVISYDLEDDDNTNSVHLYVLVAGKWILVKSGLSGDIGSNIKVDGERKEFSWHGAVSGEYFILLKASDEQYQSASEPLFIHVSWGPDGEVYEAQCPDNYPYIPFEKVISWVNVRGEVTLEDGRHVVYAPRPTECNA